MVWLFFIDSAIPAAAPDITAQVSGEANLGVAIQLSAQAEPAGVPARQSFPVKVTGELPQPDVSRNRRYVEPSDR